MAEGDEVRAVQVAVRLDHRRFPCKYCRSTSRTVLLRSFVQGGMLQVCPSDASGDSAELQHSSSAQRRSKLWP